MLRKKNIFFKESIYQNRKKRRLSLRKPEGGKPRKLLRKRIWWTQKKLVEVQEKLEKAQEKNPFYEKKPARNLNQSYETDWIHETECLSDDENGGSIF